MGASVSIVGPLLVGLQPVESAVARVITDAHGRFAVERLLPGWYSLQATSATRLPMLRNRVRVEAGQTLLENLILSDILAPLRVKVPAGKVSSWGEDWKWVLRTSSATRPVLRYQEVSKNSKKTAQPKMAKAVLPSSQRLIGMIPGSTRRRALAGDPGIDNVLAYLRPLSDDADLLVAGSMGSTGLQASSLATVFRRDLLKGDPQEMALIVRQLSFAEGLPLVPGEARDNLSHAQGLVVSYAQTRRPLDSMIVTAGMEIDYLNAARDVFSMRPHMTLEYQVSPSSVFAARYGAMRVDGDGSLLDRVGVLTAFPRVTLREYRPQLERLNHAELSFSRTLSKSGRLEVAAYRDYFENTAVWGFGKVGVLGGLAGSFLPNPAANGVTLNGGTYTSSGLRAAYTQNLNQYMQMAVLYALGDALAVAPADVAGLGQGLASRRAPPPDSDRCWQSHGPASGLPNTDHDFIRVAALRSGDGCGSLRTDQPATSALPGHPDSTAPSCFSLPPCTDRSAGGLSQPAGSGLCPHLPVWRRSAPADPGVSELPRRVLRTILGESIGLHSTAFAAPRPRWRSVVCRAESSRQRDCILVVTEIGSPYPEFRMGCKKRLEVFLSY